MERITFENLIDTTKTNPKKTVFDFFQNINDKDEFLNELKNTFPTEIGQSMTVIIEHLTLEKILNIPDRKYKGFVDVLTEYFGRKIGTYQSIQNKKNIYPEISEPIITKLKILVSKYKINQ